MNLEGKFPACQGFGWDYKSDSDACQNCGRKDNCLQEFMDAQLKVQRGDSPNIPKVKSKHSGKPAVLHFQPRTKKVPFMGNQECVTFRIHISVEWLKEHFKLGDKDH